MNCKNLKLKYEELLNLQNDFQIINAEFQKMKTNTFAQREMVAMELLSKQNNITKFIQDNFAELINTYDYKKISQWLKSETYVSVVGETRPLELLLEGGSFEALIDEQEQFYQKMYGADFKIDRSKIKIEKDRLKRIKAGLENGFVNFPLITVIPDNLTEDEKQMTEAEFAYYKNLAPLKTDDLKIWAENGTGRWTKLTLAEVLKGFIPVEVNDFDADKLGDNWQAEIIRVIEKKKSVPKIKAGKITLTFTDDTQNVFSEIGAINQDGIEVVNEFSFIEMIKSKVNTLTPEQWITLAAQLYSKNKTFLSTSTWDIMMAVIKNKPEASEQVSVAFADSDFNEVRFDSCRASNDGDASRWRLAL